MQTVPLTAWPLLPVSEQQSPLHPRMATPYAYMHPGNESGNDLQSCHAADSPWVHLGTWAACAQTKHPCVLRLSQCTPTACKGNACSTRLSRSCHRARSHAWLRVCNPGWKLAEAETVRNSFWTHVASLPCSAGDPAAGQLANTPPFHTYFVSLRNFFIKNYIIYMQVIWYKTMIISKNF